MRSARRPTATPRRWCATTLAAIAFVVALPRDAAASPEAEHAAAVESFKRGTALVETGHLQDAIDAFREALQHEPSSVGARLDLADCYEKVGAPAPAWREYVLAESYAGKANDARRAMARSAAASLEPRLLVVILRGLGAPSTSVRVDGEAVANEVVARGSLALAPGSHRVEVTAPGKRPLATEVAGKGGETRSVAVALADDTPAPRPEPGSPPRDSSQKTWAIVVGGLGLAGVVAGSVTGLVAASKKSSLESEATDPTVGAARFYDDRGAAKTFATVSTASFVVGGVGLAAGSILFFTAPSSSDRAAQVRVRPTIGGVSVDGTF